MNAKDVLLKAVQCDQSGRIMEAQNLYQDGIQILMDLVVDETDLSRKKIFYDRIKEYIDRAEQIKERIKKQVLHGEHVAQILIDEGSSGHSYNTLFGAYLCPDVKEILIEEPYLTEKYHFQNLITFLELAVKSCPKVAYIRVETKTDHKKPEIQLSWLEQIKMDMTNRNIIFTTIFDDQLKEKSIVLSNGYVIKIGRGLHYFKANDPIFSLGQSDYDFRECLQTDVNIWLTKKRQNFQNLIIFLELVVKKCPTLSYVRVITKRDQKSNDNQATTLEQIKKNLATRDITFSIKYEDTLHDRKIVIGNNYIFKIGRGLHFFKPTNPLFSLGLFDYDFRKCLQTDVDIIRTKAA